mgnify:CR=1 FL=1
MNWDIFLLAKKNGIRVDEFSLGLGPTLLGKQIGETKFSLKLLSFRRRVYDGRR